MIFSNCVLINFLNYSYQGGIFLYAVSKCLSENTKKDLIKWCESFLIYISLIIGLSLLLKGHSIIVIETHCIGFFLISGIVYREKLYDAMVAYSLCYYQCIIYLIIQYVIFGNEVNITPAKLIIEFSLIIMYFYGIGRIVEIYNNIKNERYYGYLTIIFSFIADMFLLFNEISIKSEVMSIEFMMVKIFMLLLIINIAYFVMRYLKVKKIVKLNSKLNYINKQLKIIKDSHGKTIDDMYKLYKEGREREVGEKLKSIINSNNTEIKNIEASKNENSSILHMALMRAIDDGITVNIDDGYSVELAEIDKIELYRIISNIINNARRFVGSNGVINAKTYKEEDKVVIVLENNGPKIEESQIDKIFKSGFTTKNNNDKSHGYGLNIVKELVEKNNGKIEVSSTDLITSFKISLPCD